MLYIYLLGHLRIFKDDSALQFTALPRTLPLWAYLLLNRAGPVPRESLAYTLWSDVPESVARANLRRHLYDLRQALPPVPSGRPWLLTQTGTVQWNPAADYWLDVAEFERLSASPDHLAKAVALYSGDLLPDLYDDWIVPDREQLRNMYLADLSQLVVQSRAREDYAQAIAYAQQLLNHDPLREDAVRELVSLRYQAGDRAGALQAYQRFEQLLQEELGVSPMPETRALYAAVIQSVPLPTGTHQTVAVSLATATCPHNLPAQLNEFVGRGQDLTALVDELASSDSKVRLLTLTGPAGTGKTRLALEAATDMLPGQAGTFPDGIFFVDLAPVSDPHLVLPAIAEALGVGECSPRPLLEALKDSLHSKYLLLLLDNFEQVLEAGPLVTDLLRGAPNLRILVTSRAALRVYGEHEYPVPPLPLPDLEQLSDVASLLKNASVALFVTRARERQPHFRLTAENAGAVAEICVRLDGLPLAIELAASRAKILSPADISARLSDRLAFLTDGPLDRPARHRTLRGAIDWSHDMLDEGERTLFAMLGVFAGGCTLAAAEAVSGPLCEGDVSSGLSSLLDKSLIHRFEGDDEPRFGMLASVREYALEQLSEKGLLDTLCRRHAEFYGDLVKQGRSARRGEEHVEWLRRVRAEDGNLRAALVWALDEAADSVRLAVGARLLWVLKDLWQADGRLSEARAWYAQGLAHRDRLPADTQVQLLNRAGWFAQLQGEYQAAEAYYQDSLAVARREENPELIRYSLHNLGTLAAVQEDYERAERMLAEAFEVGLEASGGVMTHALAAALCNLALVAHYQGDLERAASLLRRSLDFCRGSGDQFGTATCLENLGLVALERKDHAATRAHLRESLTLRQTLGEKTGMLACLRGLAALAMDQGRAVRSVRLYAACEALHRAFDLVMIPQNHKEVDLHIAALREQLDEADFNAAWALGESMTLDQAVAHALEADESP